MSDVGQLGQQFQALSDGTATGLIIALGAGGSFAVVLAVTLLTIRRSERREAGERRMATVGGGSDGQDAYPPQPYSAQEPHTHRPYSRPYRIPRQDTGTGSGTGTETGTGHASTNGSRPTGSTGTGVPTAPWPPTNDED
jgi:hypothetical protein